jgi:hypothetical protein
VRNIKLVWMAASRYRACPLGPIVCQHSNAASSNHNVSLPRRRKPASYAGQFCTLNDIFEMCWRRSALCLCGIGTIRTREGRASYHPWTGRVHQRPVAADGRNVSGTAILFVGGIKTVISMGIACPPGNLRQAPYRMPQRIFKDAPAVCARLRRTNSPLVLRGSALVSGPIS